MSRKNTFTLIELIVVVAIISIILSLALPAISRARHKVYSSVCASNLKGMGQAVQIYIQDFDEFAMPASFGDTRDGGYNHFINYLISVDGFAETQFQCPIMDEDDMFDPAGHDPATGNIYTKASYIMNIIKPGNWGGSGLSDTSNLSGWGLDSTTPVRVSTITNPGSKLLIMDVIEGISNSHSGVNSFQRSDHGIIADPPTGLKRWVGVRHQSRFNAVYGDGRVGAVGRSDPWEWAVNL